MARKLTKEVTTDEGEDIKLIFLALSYKGSKAVKKMFSSVKMSDEQKELTEKEEGDGLTPDEMIRALEVSEDYEDQLITVQTEAMRMSLAKGDSETWAIPASDDPGAKLIAETKREEMHDTLLGYFSIDEMNTIFAFVTTGTIQSREAIVHDNSDIEL